MYKSAVYKGNYYFFRDIADINDQHFTGFLRLVSLINRSNGTHGMDVAVFSRSLCLTVHGRKLFFKQPRYSQLRWLSSCMRHLKIVILEYT